MSPNMTGQISQQQISVANGPFTNTRGTDVIIRTSDNVDFYLSKLILSIASTFFEEMFSLAHADDVAASATHEVISVTEDSQTFDLLMRYIYPVDDPVIDDLDGLEKVMEAAVKYDLAQAVKLTSAVMCAQFLDTDTLDVYAIACRLRLEKEAKRAADTWRSTGSYNDEDADFDKTTPGSSYVVRMAQTPAGAYYRLLQYLRDPDNVAVRFTDGGDTSQPRAGGVGTEGTQAHPAPTPLYDPTGADMTLVSTDFTRFPVHSVVLRLVSAHKLLGDPEQSNGDISVGLDSATLSQLLNMCYPLTGFELNDFSTLVSIYNAANELKIQPVIDTVRRRFKSFMHDRSNLMSMYFVAVQQGWSEDAQEVARAIALQGVQNTYVAEMDNTCSSSRAYYLLLRLCHTFSQAMPSVRKRHHAGNDNGLYCGVPYDLASISLPIASRLVTVNRKSKVTVKFDPAKWIERSASYDLDLRSTLSKIDLGLDVAPSA